MEGILELCLKEKFVNFSNSKVHFHFNSICKIIMLYSKKPFFIFKTPTVNILCWSG